MTGVDQKEFYETFWSRTEDQRIHGPMGRHTRRLIRLALRGLSFKSVVDVSCGEGTMIAELFNDRNDLKIVGTDLSPSALEMARRKNPGAEFKTLDLRNGPLNEQFDLVICSEVIEHLEDDAGAIKRLAQMTRRYLLITTIGGRMRSHEKSIGHLRNYEPENLRRMIADTGLKPVKMHKWGWPFFSPLYRNLLEKLAARTTELTTGSFGPGRRILAEFLHAIFFLNSRRKGDQLVLLAERESPRPMLQQLPDEPLVSIVIPVRNEEKYMDQCIRSLKQLDYPADKLEIIFADGRSTDRTAEMARANGCKVVDNPGLNVASGRNAGFNASKGDVVGFTDADCLFKPNWVRNACRCLKQYDAAGTGGPTRVPEDQNTFGKAAGAVFELAGLLGATVQSGRENTATATDDLPGGNAFYRRDALATVMPMNTKLNTNEDVEMNSALVWQGYKLFTSPDVEVYHYKKPTPKGLWRQLHAFARGRMKLGKRDRTYLKPCHWLAGIGVPIGLLLFLISGLFFHFILTAGLMCVAGVFIAIFLYASIRHSVMVGFNAVIAAIVASVAWISGFLRELFLSSES